MDIENLKTLYLNNINRIFIPENFKELASHSNDIQGYSFMNRVLLYIQNKYSTEVKSEPSWQLENRAVNDNAVPMGIITPVIETKYTDASTGRAIKISELNQSEFAKAIMLGIINKETTIVDIKCTLVYDIRDTFSNTEQIRKKTDRKIKLSTLLELLSSIGIDVRKNDNNETTFDINTNTLKIGYDSLNSKIEKCIDTLAIKYIEQANESIEFSNLENKFIREYTVYAVCTYFGITSSINFNYIQELYEIYKSDINRLDIIIEVLDDIEHMLSSNIFNSDDPSGYAADEGHKTYIAHKAAILLSILEANYEVSGLKGV